MKSMLKFHLVGRWAEGQITCGWAESSFRPAPAVRALIEEAWEAAQRRPGVHLFDGPMCRLEDWAAEGSHLRLVLSVTSYKLFVGTNLTHPGIAERYGWAGLANPLGVSCALVSADGHLLMGKRNGRVAYYPDRIHPFAGALEPREHLDLFEEVQRELREELALDEAEIDQMCFLGLVEDRSLRQPELICLVRSRLTRSQIEQRVDRAEHEGSVAMPPDPAAVREALLRRDGLTPVGVAAALLWGREVFGESWFAERCCDAAA